MVGEMRCPRAPLAPLLAMTVPRAMAGQARALSLVWQALLAWARWPPLLLRCPQSTAPLMMGAEMPGVGASHAPCEALARQRCPTARGLAVVRLMMHATLRWPPSFWPLQLRPRRPPGVHFLPWGP